MNRKLTSGLVVLALAAACGDDGADVRRLLILHTNDEHSSLFGVGPELDDFHGASGVAIAGGVARRATVLAEERQAAAAAGIDVLTVSAGDATQGALPEVAFASTAPDFVAMKKLGYDVMCPGNHELDQGPTALAHAIEAALARGGLPQMVSTNIKLEGATELAALYGEGSSTQPIKRYHVVTTPSGIKVGLFGIMGARAAYLAALKAPVRFSGEPADEADAEKVWPALFEDLRPTIAVLRDVEKVDVVIALSHGGVNLAQPELGDDWQIAHNVAGIDLIVGGHTHDALAAPLVVVDPDGHPVPIVQAGDRGKYVGRVELVLRRGARPALDAAGARLIPVDQDVAPTLAVTAEVIDDLIAGLETAPSGGKSYLERELRRVTGDEMVDDPGTLGDLYFCPLARTRFDVIGMTGAVETNVLNLATDAMLATTDELGLPVEVAIQARGNVTADILGGATGTLAYADLFRVFPLGQNPVDGSIGYPLVRAYIWTAELKAALELALSLGQEETDFFLGVSGVRVEYDPSRPAQVLPDVTAALDPENGRITKIVIDGDHGDGYEGADRVLFDLGVGGYASWVSGPLDLHPVVTSLYVASFAAEVGASLKHPTGTSGPITEFILVRPDGSDVKDFESFISYVHSEAALEGGYLPSRYDASTAEGGLPRRWICAGAGCP
jgi:5'-nucleotidase